MSNMIFIDGTIGVCAKCGGQVEFGKHVYAIAKNGADELIYATNHPCGLRSHAVASKEDHRIVLEWLKAGRVSPHPLSAEEGILDQFREQLDDLDTSEGFAKAFG